MENFRTIASRIILLTLLFPAVSFAYEPGTTHDALTHEAVDFYNTFAPTYGTPVLTADEKALVQRGAMEEDDDYRMAHHFYDPVHNIGLKGYMSSKTWAQSPAYQASWRGGPGGCLPQPHLLYPLYESPCDFSWQRAVYEYAHGDKALALLALGHTLHLIEDASVPDHTRNDAHIPIFDEAIQQFDESFGEKSPFEGFADRFSLANGNVHTAGELLAEQALPYALFTLDNYFDHTASFSNSNFFSKSTIFDKEFSRPVVEKRVEVGVGENKKLFGEYNGHIVVNIEVSAGFDGAEKETFNLNDSEKVVLSSYWHITSREAVKNAAGVIRLFFEEVERERRTNELKSSKDALAKQASANVIKAIARVGGAGSKIIAISIRGVGDLGHFASRAVSGSIGHVVYLARGGGGATQLAVSPTPPPGLIPQTKEKEEVIAPEPAQGVPPTPEQVVAVTTQSASTLSALISNLLEARRILEAMVARNGAKVALASVATFPVGPVAPTATSTPALGEVLGASTTASVTTPPPAPAVRVDEGVPQGSSPTPPASPPPPVPEVASTTADVVASTTPPDTIPPDAPTILFLDGVAYTGEEAHFTGTSSFAITGSSESSSTVTLLAEDGATTTAYFGDVGPDLAWSFALTLSEGTTTLIFTATDEAGNVSSTTELAVAFALPPPPPPPPPVSPPWTHGTSLVISEIAWSGTVAATSDEWIEIYNMSFDSVPLDGLYVLIGDTAIPLSGTLPGDSYRVIASSGDVFSNYAPAFVHDFGSGLADEGMPVRIVYGSPESTTVVTEVPSCANWCGKGLPGGTTMMGMWASLGVTDPYWDLWITHGDLPWTFDAWTPFITDRNGNLILGTPGESEPVAIMT